MSFYLLLIILSFIIVTELNQVEHGFLSHAHFVENCVKLEHVLVDFNRWGIVLINFLQLLKHGFQRFDRSCLVAGLKQALSLLKRFLILANSRSRANWLNSS